MAISNQEIKDFCDWDYPRWLSSRSKYAKQLPLNILAQFQPSRAPIEKDYENSPLCAAFHLALMLQIDRDVNKAKCFMYAYFPKARPSPIKTLAFELGVSRETAYEWAHETAENVYRLAKINVHLNEMLREELTFRVLDTSLTKRILQTAQ